MYEPVKWGVLSTANIARTQFLPALMDAHNAVLQAVGSRDLAKAQEVASQFGAAKAYGSYDELLSDPEVEAVYIPLPNSMHKEWTIKALRAGKHVLCEKPMALNIEECDEMLQAAEEEGRLF